MTSRKKLLLKTLACALAFATFAAFTLVPVPAYAADQTVYVITKITSEPVDDEGATHQTISYNSKGLMTGWSYGFSKYANTKFMYDRKGRITKLGQQISKKRWYMFKYAYNKKGVKKVTSYKTKAFNGKKLKSYGVTKMKYKGKRIKKAAYKGKIIDFKKGGMKNGKFTATYSFKKGLVSKMVFPYPGSKFTHYFSYDAKKNLIKTVSKGNGFKTTEKVTLTYNGDKVVKKVVKYSGSKEIYTYEYKEMQVPANMVKKVKEQQYTLVNPQVNFFLYPLNVYGS